ncbi:ribonuclease Z [Evansella tamaricis]|uniref:Ribonuclease Z n=1 Tax=Evansella tamaricis TaxID=2069301 RepID=A0ABS6JJZ5_9BACI|nr:ribonuclease Z [Evansella tamaricis]
MKLTFLGTGSGVPAKHRNVSSFALHIMNKEGSVWLFDCGEATQHQILHTSIKLRKINKIFLTHLHGDHIFGLPGLLGSRSFQGAETPLTIYGPQGIKDFIEISMKISYTFLRYPLDIKEFKDEKPLFECDEFIVETGQLIHGVPSYGFRITQKDLPGPLLMEKIKEAGIPTGPHLKQLKKGSYITLNDGRSFHGRDFIGPPKKGLVVTILGDTKFSETAIRLAEQADLLVHESTFSAEDGELAFDYYHSTSTQAATVAKLAKAKQLLLNHISSRYQMEDAKELLHQAKEVFENTVLAEDFMTLQITKHLRD